MPVVASAGKTPKGRRIVVSEVCAHTSRANGRPQKSEDNPLTSRSSECLNSALASLDLDIEELA
jgi:hypothetical protein